jgi:hypothetical protein
MQRPVLRRWFFFVFVGVLSCALLFPVKEALADPLKGVSGATGGAHSPNKIAQPVHKAAESRPGTVDRGAVGRDAGSVAEPVRSANDAAKSAEKNPMVGTAGDAIKPVSRGASDAVEQGLDRTGGAFGGVTEQVRKAAEPAIAPAIEAAEPVVAPRTGAAEAVVGPVVGPTIGDALGPASGEPARGTPESSSSSGVMPPSPMTGENLYPAASEPAAMPEASPPAEPGPETAGPAVVAPAAVESGNPGEEESTQPLGNGGTPLPPSQPAITGDAPSMIPAPAPAAEAAGIFPVAEPGPGLLATQASSIAGAPSLLSAQADRASALSETSGASPRLFDRPLTITGGGSLATLGTAALEKGADDRVPRPLPFGLPFGAAASGSFEGSSGVGLELLAVLVLLPILSRLAGSSRSPCDLFRLGSSFRLVNEIPG